MRTLSSLCLAAMCGAIITARAESPVYHLAESAPVPTGCTTASVPGSAGQDSDVDGIPDSEDRCLHTAGSTSGPDGCGTGEVPVSCSGTTVASAAPAARAPLPASDADADGVSDANDRCPGTPRGTPVDDQGCVMIEKVVLKGVNFATGSATLKAGAHDTLRAVASAMKVSKSLEVEVGGYTDSVGDDGKNQALSQRRADAVKDFLVKEGVEAKRLSTKGYGESNPADTNDTPAGRANNRRVAFTVTDD